MSDFFAGIVALSILLFPIALIGFLIQLVRKRKSKKMWGIVLIFLVVCFLVSSILGIITANDNDTTQNNEAAKRTEKAEDSAAKADEKDKDAYHSDDTVQGNLPDVNSDIVKALMDEGYTLEHATEIQKILSTVGISNIEIYGGSGTGEPESGLYAMSCYANGSKEDNSRFTLTTEDGVAFYVGFLNEDLYDTDKGGFLKKYTDVHIPETEVDRETFYLLQELATQEVKELLNYPDTANFKELSWAIGRSDDNYKIIGEVNAKNGFGVKDSINFGVWFVEKDGTFILEGVTFDGIRVR